MAAKRIFIGDNQGNELTGDAGFNILYGRGGDDTLDGGQGNDILIGGLGADTFLFTAAPGAANADRILDFASGADKLVIDGLTHADIGPSGTLTDLDQRFWAAPGATGGQDADDRFVYNTTTGDLWYDADGSGSGAAQLVARFHGAPALAATDISVVNGTSPDLHLVGTDADDTLVGGAGNDTLEGMDGNDSLVGGGGTDVLLGGASDDVLVGDQAAAGFGTQLNGGDGNDSLYGAHYDFMYGGFGADAFVFTNLPPEWSPAFPGIGDFSSGSDKIVLDSAAFAEIGAAGDFAADDPRFRAVEGGELLAQDADDRIIYFIPTGELYYDADGVDGAAARLVVGLSGWTPLAAGDISVA